MKSLKYEYNRTYYKARARIWLGLRWKLFKLYLINKLFRLANRIDGKIFTSIIRGFYKYDLEKFLNER